MTQIGLMVADQYALIGENQRNLCHQRAILSSYACPALHPAIPQGLDHPTLLVLIAGHDKQGVGQPIEISNHVCADRFLAGQGDDVALRPATDRSRHVQMGRRG